MYFQRLVILFYVTQVALSHEDFTCEDISEHENIHLLPPTGSCGTGYVKSRVMGGRDAGLGQFPWMALLLSQDYRGEKSLFCGGSVINDRYILTAAHCIKKKQKRGEEILVRLGEHDLSKVQDCEDFRCAPPVQELRVERIIQHEKYNRLRDYDIALLRLESRITFTEYVQPICLPTTCNTMENQFVGTSLMVGGWGNTFDIPKEGGKDILQFVSLQVVSMDTCQHDWPAARISTLRLCAGGSGAREGGKDVCEGDSGGPLMYLNTHEGPPIHYVVVGLVSQGPGCEEATDFQPAGFYTRVGAFTQWILDNIHE